METISVNNGCILFTLSLALAIITYKIVEQPLIARNVDFHFPWRKVLPIGVTSAAMTASLGIIIIQNGSFGAQNAYANYVLEHTHYDFSEQFRTGSCFMDVNNDISTLDLNRCLPDDGRPLIVLWGSSHAAQFYKGLVEPLARFGYALGQLTGSGCLPTINLYQPTRPKCEELNDIEMTAILKRKPLAVVMDAAYQLTDEQRASFTETVTLLKRSGIKVIMLGFLPSFKKPTEEILASRALASISDRFSHPEDFQGAEYVFAIGADQYSSWVKKDLDAIYLPLLDVFCPDQKCELLDSSGKMLYAGYDHLAAEGSQMIGPVLAQRIQSALRK